MPSISKTAADSLGLTAHSVGQACREPHDDLRRREVDLMPARPPSASRAKAVPRIAGEKIVVSLNLGGRNTSPFEFVLDGDNSEVLEPF